MDGHQTFKSLIPPFKTMLNTGTVRLIAPEGLNAVRLTLCIGGVAFEDNVLATTDKSRFELQVNGETLTQLQSMLRCAGRLGGSYPVASPLMALQVDEILHVLSDVEAKMKYPQENDQDGLLKELETVTIPRFASLIEARLDRLRGVPVFNSCKERVLVHEIAVYCWVKTLHEMGPGKEISRHSCLLATESKIETRATVKQPEMQLGSRDHPKIKLTYFPFPGRAEPIRLALFIGGVPFEDERIGLDELNRRRVKLPFHQVPVLEVDGEFVSQALAILRYAGTLAGLYPAPDMQAASRVDEVLSLIDELYSSYTWNASYFEKDSTKQMELRTSLATKTLPKTLGFLEQRIVQWNGRYAVGGEFSVADLAIYSLLWTFQSGRIQGVPVSVVEPYQKLVRIYQTVASHAKVVEWTAMHQ